MKVGKVVSPEDKNGIKETILFYFSYFQKGKLTSEIDEDEMKRFERKSLTLKLVSLFDQAVKE